MRFLTPEQVADLADSIDPRYQAAVLLGAYGGLRAGELFGLRARNVDPLRRRVQITEILVEVQGHRNIGPPKTRAGRRSVPLPVSVAAALSQQLQRLAADPDALTPHEAIVNVGEGSRLGSGAPFT